MKKGFALAAAGSPGEKQTPADRRKALRRLLKYLAGHKGYLFGAILLALLSNGLALIGPMLSGFAIDALGHSGGVDFERVFLYCGLLLVCYALSAVCGYALSALMITISRQVTALLRKEMFDKLTELPVSYFDTMQPGEIISRISYDVDTIGASISNDFVQIFSSIFTVVGSFVMMVIISPLLVLVFVVTIPVSVLLTLFISRRVRPLYRKRSEKLGELNGFAEEIISGYRTVKAYNAEDSVQERFGMKNLAAGEAYYKADYYGTMAGPTQNFVTNISISLVSVLGVLMFIFDMITLGNVSSFILYSRKFAGPINEFANILSEIQSLFSAAGRVFSLLDAQPEKPDAPGALALESVEGDVEANNLDFSYVAGIKILKKLCFSIPAGKTVAIVGPTGDGKTTIINLLMRFYDPDSGTITIDGQDILQVMRKDLRAAYSMVLQDSWLFHGTIFENIAYAKEGATAEEVYRAAKAARIDSFIGALADGYDTIVDEEGMNVSKGQKQLLMIARAMLADSNMLIFDEATSNVDTKTERDIHRAMLELMKGKTCFIIAHRLPTIKHADIILVIKSGEIIEHGTHDELMAGKTFYSELYNAQFE